jgi:hypothetical protein
LSLAIPLLAAGPPAAATTPDRSPFYVDQVEVLYLESDPVQVQLVVTGSVPTPCHEPAWSVVDDGSFVSVELWSEADPEAFCSTVLQEVELVVPIGDYESARRAVLVNDRLAELIRVAQTEDGPPELVAAGWSFGMCLGYCRADLISVDDRLKLQIRDNATDTPILVNHGTLTPTGAAELSAAIEDIDTATLQEAYGCPDCADGGAAYVGLIAAGQGSRHDMPFGEPPAELATLYALTQSYIDSLETCESTALVTVDEDCQPDEGA